METTTNFLAALDAQIAAKHVLNHPFYKAWNEGTLTQAALQDYSEQYYHHVAAFPTYLSAVHSNTPCADARKALLQNLNDEEAGSPNHPELWLQFAKGLGSSKAGAAEAFPETNAIVNTFKDICKNGAYTDGIAALYAYESQIPEVSNTKIDGLKKHYAITDEPTLQYFKVHADADLVHRAEERDLLSKHVTTPVQAASALVASQRALDAIWNLLSGVCERQHIVCN